MATPSDSRYIPFTQQPSCCVPTSIQMVMYKNGIPLIPAEELGYHLGLVVHPDKAHFFYNVRTSPTPPSAGYGTRIYESEFEPNAVFKKLGIPLSLKVHGIKNMSSPDDLLAKLAEAEKKDRDVLFCFNHGALTDEDKDWGHIVVFDRIVDGQLRIVDPAPEHPKWRLVTVDKMYHAMKVHSQRKTASGIWYLNKS